MNYLFESERLYFRQFEEKDAVELYKLNIDPEVIKYTGDPPFNGAEDALSFIHSYDHYTKHGFGRWAMIRKEDEKFIGWCGLKFNEENEIDLGFRIHKEEWGSGYATEAAKACVFFGFEKLKLNRIVGRTAHENLASMRVLENAGFHFVRKTTCHGIDNAHYYVITKD